jgi:hypothetical protein
LELLFGEFIYPLHALRRPWQETGGNFFMVSAAGCLAPECGHYSLDSLSRRSVRMPPELPDVTFSDQK